MVKWGKNKKEIFKALDWAKENEVDHLLTPEGSLSGYGPKWTFNKQELFDALESGLSIDELLAQNELEWINEVGVDRNSFTVNREIVSEAFNLQDPGEGLLRTNLTLNNDTFVVIELNQVNEGSADSIPAEQSDSMLDSLRADMGNNDFQAYMTSLRENSDIQTNLEQAF